MSVPTVILLVAGCQPSPGIPIAGPQKSTVVREPPDTVVANLAVALAREGFTVDSSLGATTLRGTLDDAPRSWSDCPRVITRDPFSDANRQRSEEAQAVTAMIRVDVTTPGEGTVAALDPVFRGIYVNRFMNKPVTNLCLSTGQLERALLDAAGTPLDAGS